LDPRSDHRDILILVSNLDAAYQTAGHMDEGKDPDAQPLIRSDLHQPARRLDDRRWSFRFSGELPGPHKSVTGQLNRPDAVLGRLDVRDRPHVSVPVVSKVLAAGLCIQRPDLPLDHFQMLGLVPCFIPSLVSVQLLGVPLMLIPRSPVLAWKATR
jgi:hypothetical protein